MRKMYRIIGFLIVSLLLNACDFIYVKNKLHNQKLPIEYESYKYVDKAVIRFGDHEMTFLFESLDPIMHYLNAENNLIVITNKRIGDIDGSDVAYAIYKFDSLGILIDTFSHNDTCFENHEKLFEGYLINPLQNYYRTWVLDGDTTKKNVMKENENFEWSEEEQISYSKQIQKCKIYFTDYFSDFVDEEYVSYDKIYYLMGDKWFVFYRDTEEEFYGDEKMRGGKFVYNLFDYYYGTDKDWFSNPYENIQCQYFHKIQLEEHSDFNGGGGGSWFPRPLVEYWRGNLYTQLIVDGDTLKFKDELLLNESWTNGYFMIGDERLGSLLRAPKTSITPFLYYSNPSLQYKLFTKDERQLYMIKNIMSTK